MAPDIFSIHDQVAPQRGGLSTSSRLYAWWLLKVRKWRLAHHRREPTGMAFGQMTYRRTWVLEPPH